MNPLSLLLATLLPVGCVSEEEQQQMRNTTEDAAKLMTLGIADDSCEVEDVVGVNKVVNKKVTCETTPTQATFYCNTPSADFKTAESTVSIYGSTGLKFSSMPYASQLFADPKVCGVTVESLVAAQEQSDGPDYENYVWGP